MQILRKQLQCCLATTLPDWLRSRSSPEVVEHWQAALKGFLQGPLLGPRGHYNSGQYDKQRGWQPSSSKSAKQKKWQLTPSCVQDLTHVVSFIKSCDQYSVTGITSTLYTGSHKQHAPVNKMPKSSWVGVTLPTKLGGVDSGSVDSPNHVWLPTRVDKCTIPESHATSNTDHNRECNPHNRPV